jgi:hypothetical protein
MNQTAKHGYTIFGAIQYTYTQRMIRNGDAPLIERVKKPQ